MSDTPTTLALAQIMLHPHNVRREPAVDEQFVASIAERIIEPLVVAPVPAGLDPTPAPGQDYVLIAGHRRFRAAAQAGLEEVPVRVLADLDTVEAQVGAMLEENLQRVDLSPVEEGDAYLFLLDHASGAGEKLTQKTLAERYHRDRKTVSERVKVAKTPTSVRDRLHKGQITLDAALTVAEFNDDPGTQEKLAHALVPGRGWRFDEAVRTARAARKAQREADQERKELTDAGVKVIASGDAGDWADLQDLLAGEIGVTDADPLGHAVAEHAGQDYEDWIDGLDTWADAVEWHAATCEHHAAIEERYSGYGGAHVVRFHPACLQPTVHDELLGISRDDDPIYHAGEDGDEPARARPPRPGQAAPVAEPEEDPETKARREELERLDAERNSWLADQLRFPDRERPQMVTLAAQRLSKDLPKAPSGDGSWDVATRREMAPLVGLPEDATGEEINTRIQETARSATLAQLVLLTGAFRPLQYGQLPMRTPGGWANGWATGRIHIFHGLGWDWTDTELDEIRQHPTLAKDLALADEQEYTDHDAEGDDGEAGDAA